MQFTFPLLRAAADGKDKVSKGNEGRLRQKKTICVKKKNRPNVRKMFQTSLNVAKDLPELSGFANVERKEKTGIL